MEKVKKTFLFQKVDYLEDQKYEEYCKNHFCGEIEHCKLHIKNNIDKLTLTEHQQELVYFEKLKEHLISIDNKLESIINLNKDNLLILLKEHNDPQYTNQTIKDDNFNQFFEILKTNKTIVYKRRIAYYFRTFAIKIQEIKREN